MSSIWLLVVVLFPVYLASRRGWKTWQAGLAGILLGSVVSGMASVARDFRFESFVEGAALFYMGIAQVVIATLAEYTELFRLFSPGGLKYFLRPSNIQIPLAVITGFVAATQGDQHRGSHDHRSKDRRRVHIPSQNKRGRRCNPLPIL